MQNRKCTNRLILAVFFSCASVAFAENSLGFVTSIREMGVDLKDVSGNIKEAKIKSSNSLPWKILKIEGNGTIKVHIDKQGDYWVKMTQVVTDRPVTVIAACGPQLAQSANIGGVRGIGEECKK